MMYVILKKHTVKGYYVMVRIIGLSLLLVLSLTLNGIIRLLAPFPDGPSQPFLSLWGLHFLVYFGACFLVCTTSASTGRRCWIELALLLVGALLLRTILLPIPPNLSRDSWRYVWDARATLNGFSPYVYPPGSPELLHLRDFLYDNSRFRNVPTIYPPAAQGIYLLSYLIVPSSLVALKTIFMGFDLLTCGLLAYFLYRRGLDPARCVIYAWCPLPIFEFAMQGHVDVLTISFTLLALVTSLRPQRHMRALTGFWLALATMTKFFPLIFVVALARRRDWWLLVSCALTIVLGYIPFLLLGNGQVFGFLTTYANERGGNGGLVVLAIKWLAGIFSIGGPLLRYGEYLLFMAIIGGSVLALRRLRLQERIPPETAILLLIGTVFLVSPHIFPWYTAILLPWIALLLRPIWTPRDGLSPLGLIVAASWYLVCLTPTSYYFEDRDPTPYFWILYVPLWLALLLASLTFFTKRGLFTRLHRVKKDATINVIETGEN